jgi:hypothetical protein
VALLRNTAVVKPTQTGSIEQTLNRPEVSVTKQRFLERLGETNGEWLYSAEATPPFRAWSSRRLGDGHLHVSPGTRVEMLNGGLIIGEWIAIPEAETGSAPDVHATARQTLAGQFTVLSRDRISCDPGCLKPVFFHQERRLASSSPRLLAELTGATLAPSEVLHGSRPDWLPGPSTRASGVRRLLPSQQLSLADVRPVATMLVSDAGATDPVGEIATALRAIFRGFRERNEEVWVGLTGGYDSRVLLSAAVAAGARTVAFTFAGPLIPDETEVTARLAALAGVPYRVLGPAPVDRNERDYVLWQSIGQCAGLDIDICAAGLWSEIPAGALVIRGLGGEFGRQFYHGVLPDTGWSNGGDRSQLYMQLARPWLRGRQPHTERAFAEWLDWVAATPAAFDPRDRLYLEQRVGAWGSSNEQALSATQRRRINPMNADYIYARMNRIPAEMKKTSAWQEEVIGTLAPQLRDAPYYSENRLRKISRFALTLNRGLQFRRNDRRVQAM